MHVCIDEHEGGYLGESRYLICTEDFMPHFELS